MPDWLVFVNIAYVRPNVRLCFILLYRMYTSMCIMHVCSRAYACVHRTSDKRILVYNEFGPVYSSMVMSNVYVCVCVRSRKI